MTPRLSATLHQDDRLRHLHAGAQCLSHSRCKLKDGKVGLDRGARGSPKARIQDWPGPLPRGRCSWQQGRQASFED